MLKKEKDKIDREWIILMEEAYWLGLSVTEVKEFIRLQSKKFVISIDSDA
ncbi:anti-repressor SinI family protein [Priestia megaterium]